MSRPVGVRNHDFDEKRTALLQTLTQFALEQDLRRPSLRQFAMAAETSEPTLRHYFGDRQGLVIAIIEHYAKRAQVQWAVTGIPGESVAESVEQYFRIAEAGMRRIGYARAHAFGLIEGMADDKVGRAYLELLLEPGLKMAENKLTGTPGGPKTRSEARAAALAMMAPVFIMCIHQDLLGGTETAPIESEGFFKAMTALVTKGLTS